LEREGRDYDLYADHQLHTGELDLDAYRALVLDAHPEYWSRAMYERVKAWVHDRGGRLIYLGGNGIDCEVEVQGDHALRFLTQQPDPAVPGEEHLECRFHRTVESPAALLGVVFSHSGEGTAAPYRVLDAGHWTLAGTGLAAGDRFGERTLHERVPGGASGHETDKLTPSSPHDVVVIARGENPDGGGAVMVTRELAGGGAVFATGSITFIASLLIDPHTSRIASNVLDCFTDRNGDT
jgi:N,N-dimethylformamidase beta subunit-like protein